MTMRGVAASLSILLVLCAAPARALDPPADVRLEDMPYDDGKALALTWEVAADEADGDIYVIEATVGDGPLLEVARLKPDSERRYLASEKTWPFWAWSRDPQRHFFELKKYRVIGEDDQPADRALAPDVLCRVRLLRLRGDERAPGQVLEAAPRGDLFNLPKLNNLVYALLFSGIILAFIARARRQELFLRRIPGLDAVDEAIGRATEMGRPIYYLTGRKDISEVPTIAASIILGEVAKKVAAYDTQLKVPHTYAMTMAVCQEITKEAYTEAGRPDAFHEDINFFITEDQFSYAAAVEGMMMRERPAACFYMGYYYAESLLLAETGAETGAIQVAGTDAEHQLPFFVTACDYTLIGEELYAASAYLSRKPELVGTLRGQDVAKAFFMTVMLLGTLAATAGALFAWSPATLGYILDAFRSF